MLGCFGDFFFLGKNKQKNPNKNKATLSLFYLKLKGFIILRIVIFEIV